MGPQKHAAPGPQQAAGGQPVVGQVVYATGAPPGQMHPVAYAQPQYQAAGPLVDWRWGLCDCCDDPGLCCDVYWCGFCHMARQYSAAVENRPDDPNWALCCMFCLCTYVVGGIVPCLITWYLRDQVRTKYNVQGNACEDCCTACWCGCCALIQQHRELSVRGLPPGICCCGPLPNLAQMQQPGAAYAGQPQPGYAVK